MNTCGSCKRERTIGDPAHPMDSYDYSPVQAITGQPFGWYSSDDDGELCPEDMEQIIRGQVASNEA